MNPRELLSVAADPRLPFNPVTWARYLRPAPGTDLEAAAVSFSVDLERNMRSSDPFEGVERSALRLGALFREKDVSATFFVTGRVAREFPDLVAELSRDFEVGYHGHEHGNWGGARWDMPEPLSRKEKASFLQEDIPLLRELTGERPVSFRAPRLNSSRETRELLEEHGFEVDSSYPSFLGGNPGVRPLGDRLVQVPVTAATRPRLVSDPFPRFSFPFLDTYTLREIGRKRFLELCREAATDIQGRPFLAMFGHQWEFGKEADLNPLDELFSELGARGIEFVEVRDVPGLL